MKSGRCLYAGALLVALVVGLGLWNPIKVKAGHERDRTPKFRVDPYWPKPLPAPVGTDGFAHRWVQGEVAGSCIDQWDNVYTYNRAWEVGATVNGVLQNNQSGAITGQEGTPAKAIPSPPVVVFNSEGKTIAGWGNPSLNTGTASGAYTAAAATGRAGYMPNGSHGCYVDYQGDVWLGGNGDGIVQKYNPATAAPAGAAATYVYQIGVKDNCDTTSGICGESGAQNTAPAVGTAGSATKLNEPPDIAVDPLPDPVTGTPGSVYIADGYGNHRVIVFTTADGGQTYQFNRQFGSNCGHNQIDNGTTTPGNPCPLGTFGATGGGHPHCVVLGNDGLVYTCDRPNSRIEVWTKTGTVLSQIPINNFPTATAANVASILSASNRSCDIDFYPNVDYLAGKSPTHQKYIVNVDLQSDNTYLLDKSTGEALSAFGRCGLAPCPGHNAGEFAYNHTAAVDSQGSVYVAETIVGRRIQKFVRVDDDGDHH
jgi:hypothetical protein